MTEYEHFRSTGPTAASPWKIVRSAAVCMIAFVVAAVGINRLVTGPFWRPYLGEESDKLAKWKDVSGSIDVVFIGSSRIDYAIDPEVFDATTAALGRRTTSFNMAVLDLRAPERAAMLDSMAAAATPKLKYVFFEAALNYTPDLNNYLLRRMRYHYNWDSVPLAVRTKLDARRSLPLRLASASAILLEFAVHNLNLGVLSDLAMPKLLPEDPSGRVKLIKRGYVGDIESQEWLSSNRFKAIWLAGGKKRDIDRAGLAMPIRELSKSELAALEGMFARIRRLGAEPIALIPPQLSELDQARAVASGIRSHFPNVTVLDYSYKGVSERLYDDIDLWRDDGHLSKTGSELFSRIIASDWERICHNRGSI